MYTKVIIIFQFCLFCVLMNGQNFQQKVDHYIKAKLDDQTHVVKAEQQLIYHNESPDTLTYLILHLWANAYKDNSTAFAKQQLFLGNRRFHFASDADRGGFQRFECKQGDNWLSFEAYESHEDVVKIPLIKPILPKSGDTLYIEFELKIPQSFSRLGRTPNAYQLTQWFPKPAVYDNQSWHPMPYMDMGEFFSEFGDYRVEIEVPSAYKVAATGVLQNKEILDHYLKHSNQKKIVPSLADSMIKYEYIAKNVHDFAIFMDRNYMIDHTRMQVPSGDSIDVWSFYTPKAKMIWDSSTFYLKRSIEFYSNEVGAYPYPQVTAVEGALSAGAGMEYPMITIIGSERTHFSLDVVITHEVGHNWWYGVLASNERLYPWLDEGINTFYEQLYIDRYYNRSEPFDIDFEYNYWQHLHSQKKTMPPNTHSCCQNEDQYYLGAYWKAGKLFRKLYATAGELKFRKAMHQFYQQHQFTHYSPQNFRNHFESNLDIPLEWLFDQQINEDVTIDLGIKNINLDKEQLKFDLFNNQPYAYPAQLDIFEGDSLLQTHQLFISQGDTDLAIIHIDSADRISLNGDRFLPELDIHNNLLLRNKNDQWVSPPANLGFLWKVERMESRRLLNVAPAMGYNAADGVQAGIYFNNLAIPTHPFEFSFLPMYAFHSKQLNALGEMRYTKYRSGKLKRWFVGLGYRSNSIDKLEEVDAFSRFHRWKVFSELKFKQDHLSYGAHYLRMNYFQLLRIPNHQQKGENLRYNSIPELEYVYENLDPIYARRVNFNLQWIDFESLRLSLHYLQELYYSENAKIQWNAFLGYIPHYSGDLDFAFYAPGGTGNGIHQRDYLFDEILIGRNQSGFWGQQIFERDALLKTRANDIRSTRWMLGLGTRLELPIPHYIPLQPYFDMLWYENTDASAAWVGSAGIVVSLFRRTLEIYIPIWNSQSLRSNRIFDRYPSYLQQITFSIQLKQWNPIHLTKTNLF